MMLLKRKLCTSEEYDTVLESNVLFWREMRFSGGIDTVLEGMMQLWWEIVWHFSLEPPPSYFPWNKHKKILG